MRGFESESNQGLPTAVRRERVRETIRDREFASVGDLSAAFGVSEVTIRSDLDALAGGGHVRRVRGGAVHRAGPRLETPFEVAVDSHAVEKALIGRVAAAMVENAQTVLMDAGSTIAAVAHAIAARPDLRDIHVFTNGMRVALELEPAIPNATVIVTGGALRPQQHSLVNPFGMVILEQIHAHLGFLGCQGIDAEAGVTHVNVAEAEVARLVMRASRRRVLVADGSKVGQVSLVHLYGIHDIDLLVTDSSADPGALAALRDRGLEVLVADAPAPVMGPTAGSAADPTSGPTTAPTAE
jgi:DeoR family transcriptional regulator, aga operon transcriptional repressor